MFDRSRRRLTYWYTFSMGSILILFAFTLYQRQVTERKGEFDEQIYNRANKIASATNYQQQGKTWQIDIDNVSSVDREILTESNIIYLRWYDERKHLLQHIGNSSLQVSQVIPGWQTLKSNKPNAIAQSERLRILTLPLKYDRSLVGYLQVAVSLEPVEESLRRSRLFLAIGMPITLGFTAIAGWILAGYAMQPVRRSYEQLQRFTADASHELRAPVAAILSNAQVGLLVPPEDIEQPRQRLQNIVIQSKHMSALIANLLFLARHQGKLNPQDIIKTDIPQLLNALAQKYQTLANERGLEFHADIPMVSKEIYCDRDLLQQAIHNLLDNALKYTPSGGMVTLKLTVKPRRLEIAVRDTGIGIPAIDLPHIFDRFYRVDKARTRHGGFGLGLAISRQIIHAHKGKITVDSATGRGTTFLVCLPL